MFNDIIILIYWVA